MTWVTGTDRPVSTLAFARAGDALALSPGFGGGVLSLRRAGHYARSMPESVAPVSSAARDADLARRVAAAAPGTDASAEAEICRRFAPRVRLYGLRHLRDPAAAADLAQEVLIIVLQKLRSGGLDDFERLASFVLGTARQCVIDSRRTARRREQILEAFPVEFPSLFEERTEHLDSERLRNCLQALAERERAVLMMSFYDDDPAGVVGSGLGLSPANVRVIRHRGIRHLRECMKLDVELS